MGKDEALRRAQKNNIPIIYIECSCDTQEALRLILQGTDLNKEEFGLILKDKQRYYYGMITRRIGHFHSRTTSLENNVKRLIEEKIIVAAHIS